jgi:hypothetical protein
MHPSDISQDPMQCSIGCLHKNHLEALGATHGLHGPEKNENRNIDAMFDYHRVKPMKCNPRKTIIRQPYFHAGNPIEMDLFQDGLLLLYLQKTQRY